MKTCTRCSAQIESHRAYCSERCKRDMDNERRRAKRLIARQFEPARKEYDWAMARRVREHLAEWPT